MSGHSKWSQIKHKKGISDQKKGQIFSKLAKKISITAREGQDPASNYKLQSAIDEARSLNMPKENIERAIKRAGDKDAAVLENLVIQAVGPAGVAIVIEAITDNKNRTISEIKHLLGQHEAKMVPENSLNWMFTQHQFGTVQTGAGFGKSWEANAPIEAAPEVQQKLDKLFEALDNHDDVESVHTNLK